VARPLYADDNADDDDCDTVFTAGASGPRDAVMHVIKSKCIPILLYAVQACPVNRSLEKSLQFSVTRILMKIFKTRSSEIVTECQTYFGF